MRASIRLVIDSLVNDAAQMFDFQQMWCVHCNALVGHHAGRGAASALHWSVTGPGAPRRQGRRPFKAMAALARVRVLPDH